MTLGGFKALFTVVLAAGFTMFAWLTVNQAPHPVLLFFLLMLVGPSLVIAYQIGRRDGMHDLRNKR